MLFLKNKDKGNPRACVRIHTYGHAWLSSTYVYTGMHMHVKVPETMKDKFFYIKHEFWNEFHIIWEPFQTPIFSLYKDIHSNFSKHIENPKGKYKIC